MFVVCCSDLIEPTNDQHLAGDLGDGGSITLSDFIMDDVYIDGVECVIWEGLCRILLYINIDLLSIHLLSVSRI